jgi:hypothetical protein
LSEKVNESNNIASTTDISATTLADNVNINEVAAESEVYTPEAVKTFCEIELNRYVHDNPDEEDEELENVLNTINDFLESNVFDEAHTLKVLNYC